MTSFSTPSRSLHASLVTTLALVLAGCSSGPQPRQAATARSAQALPVIPFVNSAQQTAAHWLARLDDPDRSMLDPAAIDAQNARLRSEDPSIHDLHAVPARMTGDEVKAMVGKLSRPPSRKLYDVAGREIDAATLQA